MTWILFIDDLRDPSYVGLTGSTLDRTVVARSSASAISEVMSRGMPSDIYFDHDLGGDDTSINFVNWLIDYDMTNDVINTSNLYYHIHSSNPVGADNIRGKLEHYLRWKESLINNPF